MVDFSSQFSNSHDRFIMDALGDDVIYCNKPIKAMCVYAQQNTTIQDSYLNNPQITITAFKSDVPNISRGSKFKHNGNNLIVDAPVNDTETHITLAVNYD